MTEAKRYRIAADSLASIQDALTRLGYCPGPIDGEVGLRTKSAVRAFQSDHGLEENGCVDEPTVLELRKAIRRRSPVA